MASMSLLFCLSLGALAAEPVSLRSALDRASAHRDSRLAQVPAIQQDQYDKAAAGQVATELVAVEGERARKVTAVGVVDVPIGAFWAAINDDPGKVDYSKLAYAEVLSGEVCGNQRRVFQFLPITMASDRWWVFDVRTNTTLHEATDGEVREMIWKSTDSAQLSPMATGWSEKGMQVDFTEGAWLLVALDEGRTLVEYYAWSDPGGMVPAALASSFAGGAVPDLYEAMTNFARAGSRCSG